MNFLKNLFKHRQDPSIIDIRDLIPEREEVEICLPEVRIIKAFDYSKKSILIIDDSKGITSIVEDYLLSCNIDTSDYNILTFFGGYAPFVMQKTLDRIVEKGDIMIVGAIIDIVLPGKMKTEGKYIKWDGIDVAIYLNKNFGLRNFLFYTGNVISMYVEFIKDKSFKFKAYFNKDIKDFIIFKSEQETSEVISEICKMIKKEKYVL